MQFLKVNPDAWRELVRKIRGFRIVAGRNASVQTLADGYQINCECKDIGQRQYGGSGGVAAYYKLKPVGGTAGTATTPCTFAYDMWPLSETAFTDTTRRIATNLQPQPIHRDQTGGYTQAAQGTIGEAIQVETTPGVFAWVLLTAFGERRLTLGCA